MRERNSRELKPIVGLVNVALAKHPAVFSHGKGAFPLSVFARILAVVPVATASLRVRTQVSSLQVGPPAISSTSNRYFMMAG